jgi:hypothetical protein
MELNKNVDQLKNIPVDSDDKPITPSENTILSFLFREEELFPNNYSDKSIATSSSGYGSRNNYLLKLLILFFIFSILFLPSPLFLFDKISENKKIITTVKIVLIILVYLFLYKL